MSEFFTVGLQEAEKSTRNKVETVSPDTLYNVVKLKLYNTNFKLNQKHGNNIDRYLTMDKI